MSKLRLFALLACSAALPQVNQAAGANINVKEPPYSARGDGSTDDAPAIQRALNAAYSAGAGTVYFPCGTYALATVTQVGKYGHHYLLAKSGVHLQGESKDCVNLLPTNYQGLEGISTLMFSRTNWDAQAYEESKFFDGKTWYQLNATTSNSRTVTLSEAAQASNFKAGDYVYISYVGAQTTVATDMTSSQNTCSLTSTAGFSPTYPYYIWAGYVEQIQITGLLRGTTYNCVRQAYNSAPAQAWQAGTVIQLASVRGNPIVPSEPSRILAVDSTNGILTLEYPLARSFSNAIIARVSLVTTHDVGVSDMTIHGQYVVGVQNVFNLSVERVRLVADSSSSSNLNYWAANGARGVTIKDCEFMPSGSRKGWLAFGANNSEDILVEGTKIVSDIIIDNEFPAHYTLRNNNISLTPRPGQHYGMLVQGQDMLVQNNTITIQNIPAGLYGLTDFYTVAEMAAFVGLQTRFADNNISCTGASSVVCVELKGHDTTISGGHLDAGGNGLTAMRVNDAAQPTPQHVTVSNVQFEGLAGKYGAVISQTANGSDGITFTNNTLEGSAVHGVFLADPRSANKGSGTITGNRISSGIKIQLTWNQSNHPNIVTDIGGAGATLRH